MTAFDASTNTGAASFTNAYGTVQFPVSAVAQKASGFVRTEGWRYFEWHIDANGSLAYTHLFAGVGTPVTPGALDGNRLYGGNSRRAAVVGLTFAPPDPYTQHPFRMTVDVGDTFMFAVDMTGSGRAHDGAVVQTTITDGSGGVLIPLVVDHGKNGVWAPASLRVRTYARPSYGLPMQVVPWAARDSVSSGTAKVSLRVVSTSFAYPIPAGMVAWGDGPEGTLIDPNNYTLAWDPAIVNRGSLSDSNRYCIFTGTGESTTAGYVMSLNLLGLTGKRYCEIWNTPAGTSAGNPTQAETGLYDVSSITNTFFDATEGGNALIFKEGNTAWRRGVNVVTSITNAHLSPFNTTNLALNGCGWMIDFDNKLAWFCQPYAGSGSGFGPWMGNHSLSASVTLNWGVTPYSMGAKSSLKGIPLSITAATSLLRVGIKDRQGSLGIVTNFYLNGGQLPFAFYPLLPGARSMNGGRLVTPGQGDSWDVVNNPASATYGAAGVTINKKTYAGAAQCAQVKSSGKQYFELHLEQDRNIAGWYLGLRREAATTLTHANQLNRIDQALVVQPLSNGGARWRYGVNIGSWTATASYSSTGVGSMAPWHGVAVDFDLGHLWVGSWNYNERTMHWGAASDPATGVNPHLTFTANERLRIFVNDGDSTVWRVNLVQDDMNVVGLPAGFVTWGGTAPASVTATPSPSPSAVAVAGIRNIWPTGVMT